MRHRPRLVTTDEIAAVSARDIPAGSFVNLGIGLPTKVANYLPTVPTSVLLHTENGMLGMGPELATGETPTPISSTRARFR